MNCFLYFQDEINGKARQIFVYSSDELNKFVWQEKEKIRTPSFLQVSYLPLGIRRACFFKALS